MGYVLLNSCEGMEYKDGDKVVVKNGVTTNGINLSNKVVKIVGIRDWYYNTPDYMIDVDKDYCLNERDINHEATEKLKRYGLILTDINEKTKYESRLDERCKPTKLSVRQGYRV